MAIADPCLLSIARTAYLCFTISLAALVALAVNVFLLKMFQNLLAFRPGFPAMVGNDAVIPAQVASDPKLILEYPPVSRHIYELVIATIMRNSQPNFSNCTMT